MTTRSGRRSLVDGVTNFRDLGGHPTSDGRVVRRGLVYRSGSLHDLSEHDLTRLRELGIRTAFDLRSGVERDAEPLAAPFIRWVRVPLERSTDAAALTDFDNGEDFLRAQYRGILFDLADEIGSVLAALARQDTVPAVIHCAAGKDRTGVVSAVLLLALGVDDALALDDYELTSEYQSPERVQEIIVKLAGVVPPALVAGLLGTNRSALADALGELRRRYGTVDDYLTDAGGLTPGDLDALRSRLTA